MLKSLSSILGFFEGYLLYESYLFSVLGFLLVVFGQMMLAQVDFAAEEGIGDGQLEEQEGEEAYELPLRGLRNDQGGMFILVHPVAFNLFPYSFAHPQTILLSPAAVLMYTYVLHTGEFVYACFFILVINKY